MFCREGGTWITIACLSWVLPAPLAPAPTACTLMTLQMLARIAMNRDSAELGQDSDNGEKTAGVSSFFVVMF